jgi:putative aminopeptidase FrvX
MPKQPHPPQTNSKGSRPWDPTETLLAELSNAPGAGGFEGPIISIVKREIGPFVKKLTIDAMGNVVGERRGSSDSPRILLQAHMDEVGFLVRAITPEGFIIFNPIGGWLPQVLLAQRWRIETPKGPIYGVTGVKAGHITPLEERNTVIQQENMFIDIGARGEAEARRLGIRPGLPIVPASEFTVLSNPRRYAAKAFDDRASLAVIIEALKQLAGKKHPNTVVVAATVQEEIGMRGAHPVAFSVRPDVALNLEIGVAGDYPSVTPKLAQEKLGAGPAIFVYDNSMIPNNKLVEYIIDFAEKKKIPFQFSSVTGYGDDASVTQRFAPNGALAVNLGIPARYAHTHTTVIDRDDFDATVKLIVGLVQQLSEADVKRLREW